MSYKVEIYSYVNNSWDIAYYFDYFNGKDGKRKKAIFKNKNRAEEISTLAKVMSGGIIKTRIVSTKK